MTCDFVVALFISEVFVLLSGILSYFLLQKATFIFVVQLVSVLITLWLFEFLLYWISPGCLV